MACIKQCFFNLIKKDNLISESANILANILASVNFCPDSKAPYSNSYQELQSKNEQIFRPC